MPDPVSPCGPNFTFEECGFDLAETLLPSPQGQCPEEGCSVGDFDINGNKTEDNFGPAGDLLAGATGALGPWGPGGTPGRGISGNVGNPTGPGPIVVTFTGGTIPCGAPLGSNLGQFSVSGGGNTGPAAYHADFTSGGEAFSGWLDTGASYSGPGYKNSLFTALPSSGKNPDELYPPGKTFNVGILITILNPDGTPTTKTTTVNQTLTVVDTGNCGGATGGGGSGSLPSIPSQGSESATPDCGYEVWQWQKIGAKGFTIEASDDFVGYSSIGISDPYFSIKEIINGEVNINTATGVAVVGGAGQVISVTVINRGGGYKSAPTISFDTGGGGTKFTAQLTEKCVTCFPLDSSKDTYGVESITIVTPGSGLTGTETLLIGGGATATLTTLGGAASEVTVTNKGDGFKLGSPPLVRLIGSKGSAPISGEGAVATCEITATSKSVSKVTITEGGKNYSVAAPPKVIFSPAPDVQTGCPESKGGRGPGKIVEVCAPLNPRETVGLREADSAVSIKFDQNADTASKFKNNEKKAAVGTVESVGNGFANIAITDGGSFVYYEGSAITITGPGDRDPSAVTTDSQIENTTFKINGIITKVQTKEDSASLSLAASAAANPPPCEVGQWVKVQSCGQGCEVEDQNSSTFGGQPARQYVRVGVPYSGVLHYAIIEAPSNWGGLLTPPTIATSTVGMPTNALNFPGGGGKAATTISLSTYFNSGNLNPDVGGQITLEMASNNGGLAYPPSCDGPQGAMDTGGVGKPDNGLGASSKRRYPCVKSGAPLGYGEFSPIIKKIPPKEKKEIPCKKGDCDKFFSTWMAQAVGSQDENNSFEVNWILLEGCPEPCVNSKPDSNARIVESTLVDIPCSCYEVEEVKNIETPDDKKPKNDYGIFSWKKFFNK
jgi:hypothetical protein